jgi:hypothetical protein
MIMWLIFNKYEAKKEEVDERKVEGKVSFPNFAKWVRGAVREH